MKIKYKDLNVGAEICIDEHVSVMKFRCDGLACNHIAVATWGKRRGEIIRIEPDSEFKENQIMHWGKPND